EAKEAGEKTNGKRQQSGEGAFDLGGGAFDLAGGNGDDGVDEGFHGSRDLCEFLHEHHHGVVDRQDRGNETGAGNEQRDELRYGLFDGGIDDESLDAVDQRVLELPELFLDELPCRAGTALDERDHHIEGGLERLHDRLPSRSQGLDDLAANLRPGDAEYGERKLSELDQRQSLRDVDSGQGAGQPVDQSFF